MNKKEFESLVISLMCTEDRMPRPEDVVSDTDIIAKIERVDDLEQQDRDGRTLLNNAACYSRKAIVEYLIKCGADINTRDNKGFTPLHCAVANNQVEIVKLLLQTGAEVNAKNMYGNPPLMTGDLGTNLEIFKLLIYYGADPYLNNDYGVSALDIYVTSNIIIDIIKKETTGRQNT